MRADLVELKRRIDGLVTKAFDRCYNRSENVWVSVEKITLDYFAEDDYDDLPFISVSVRYFVDKLMETQAYLELNVFPDMSDDYNIGHLASAFERGESD